MTSQFTFHALLIVGGNPESRKQEAFDQASGLERSGLERRNQLNGLDRVQQDRLVIQAADEEKSVGIEKIRDLKEWSSFKPSEGKVKVAIIIEAQTLTTEAQNALLKTLEEPPKGTIIILSAPDKQNLLNTVTSRCFIKELPFPDPIALGQNTETIDGIYSIEYLLSTTKKDFLELTENNSKILSDPKELLTIIDSWLLKLRQLLIGKEIGKTFFLERGRALDLLDQIITVKETLLRTNTNPRLLIETLFLNLI